MNRKKAEAKFKSVLYHGTTSRFVHGISKRGLLASPPHRNFYTKMMRPAEQSIYLATEPSFAVSYAVGASSSLGGFPAIVIVEADTSEKSFRQDEDFISIIFYKAMTAIKDNAFMSGKKFLREEDSLYLKFLFPDVNPKEFVSLVEYLNKEERRRVNDPELIEQGSGPLQIFRDNEEYMLKKWSWLGKKDLSKYVYKTLRHVGNITRGKIKDIIFVPSWIMEDLDYRYKPHPVFEADIIKAYKEIRKKRLKVVSDALKKTKLTKEDLEKYKLFRDKSRPPYQIEEKFPEDSKTKLAYIDNLWSHVNAKMKERRYYWSNPIDRSTTMSDFFFKWFSYRLYKRFARPYIAWRR